MTRHDDDDPRDFGPCCACGATGPTVRNLLMIERRAPVPGTGWGCVVCGLPADGAVAVLCDQCIDTRVSPRQACLGYPASLERMPIDELTEPFTHDAARHRDELHRQDGRPRRSRGRRVPPPTTSPASPTSILHGDVVTRSPHDDEAWIDAERRRTLDSHVVACGVMQSSTSGNFHTWVSLYGTDLTSWYVGPDLAYATGAMQAIRSLFADWHGTTEDVDNMDALFDVLREESSDVDALLPDDAVREALAEVAKMVQRRN